MNEQPDVIVNEYNGESYLRLTTHQQINLNLHLELNDYKSLVSLYRQIIANTEKLDALFTAKLAELSHAYELKEAVEAANETIADARCDDEASDRHGARRAVCEEIYKDLQALLGGTVPEAVIKLHKELDALREFVSDVADDNINGYQNRARKLLEEFK